MRPSSNASAALRGVAKRIESKDMLFFVERERFGWCPILSSDFGERGVVEASC
jgi:hypothetical protein